MAVRRAHRSLVDDEIHGRHWAARVSLLSSALAIVAVAAYAVSNPIGSAGALVSLGGAMTCGWYAAGHRRFRPLLVTAAGLLLIGVLVLLLDTRRDAALAAAVVAFALTSLVSAHIAFRHGITVVREAVAMPVKPVVRPVLLVNPRSGEGKAERSGLLAAARERAVTVVELGPADDLRGLAEQAVRDGTDALAMAGGDGSQAIVADVAAAHDLPMVCIASGTRNHFAADLGLDRRDVPSGLAAFDTALERLVDLGEIEDGGGNRRVFVNNVVLGVYGQAVQNHNYRAAKGTTVMDVLQRYAGPESFDLRFAGPDGTPHPRPDVVFVGNNPYRLASLAGFGARERLDTAHLGIVVVRIDHPSHLSELAALELACHPHLFRGWTEWTTSELLVDSDEPIAAGIDGEAATLAPPVRFRVRPGAVRVRVPQPTSRRTSRIPSPLRALTALAHHGQPVGLAVSSGEQLGGAGTVPDL